MTFASYCNTSQLCQILQIVWFSPSEAILGVLYLNLPNSHPIPPETALIVELQASISHFPDILNCPGFEDISFQHINFVIRNFQICP